MVSFKQLFTPVDSLDADQLKAFMESHEEGTYTLLDVRQPKEYEQHHLPGAKLVPLPELENALARIDPEKPTVVYWAAGGRSRVAAQLLSGKGFKNIYNMSGGINAWDGNKAVGPRELNMDLITGEESSSEMIAIAYHMEDGLGRFYKAAGNKAEDADLIRLLNTLSEIEEKHKQSLLSLSSELNPESAKFEALNTEFMEGGFDSTAFLETNRAFLSKTTDVLDLAMMLETQSMDLYLRFADKSSHPETQKVLFKIASEEKAHLKSLGKLYDEKI